MMTVTQAATWAGVSGARVRQYLDEGRIIGFKVGPMWMIDDGEVKRWAQNRRGAGRPKKTSPGRARSKQETFAFGG